MAMAVILKRHTIHSYISTDRIYREYFNCNHFHELGFICVYDSYLSCLVSNCFIDLNLFDLLTWKPDNQYYVGSG